MSDVLTPERVLELLSQNKSRGTYGPDIQNFVDSGELALVFSDLPHYTGKDAQATRNSIKGNIEKLAKENDWPELAITFDKVDPKDKKSWKVVLINMDVLSAAA